MREQRESLQGNADLGGTAMTPLELVGRWFQDAVYEETQNCGTHTYPQVLLSSNLMASMLSFLLRLSLARESLGMR